ncbi:MAG: superoxide dismutase family protein [Alphaproteobacteria bacterium]|nr:superoxide dismutase family protein [Alphaproteobacteria bacterium]
MKYLLTLSSAIVALGAGSAYAEDAAPEATAAPAVEAAADHAPAAEAVPMAVAKIFNDKGEQIGSASFMQGTIGVMADIKVEGLPPGAHGMHIHALGSCDHEDHFKSAGGHVNPDGKMHGYLNAEGPEKGDLPNIVVGENGSAQVELFLPQFNVSGEGTVLLDDDGSALMIHEAADDYVTQPIGGSGARIACGVIEAK